MKNQQRGATQFSRVVSEFKADGKENKLDRYDDDGGGGVGGITKFRNGEGMMLIISGGASLTGN